MVALFGFLEQSEVFVEHGLLGEGDAVDAYKLLAFFVTAPECTGERHYLGCLDRCCGGDVRAAAKVGEIALCVCRYGAVLQFGDKLAFVLFVFVAEELECVSFGNVGTYDCLVLFCKLQHFGFDFGKIVGCELVVARVDVVVKTVFDCRTYAEPNPGIQFLQGFGQQVGRTVPESVLALGVFPFVKPDTGVFADGAAEVPFFVVDTGGENFAGQTGRDSFGNLERRNADFKFLYAVVGKCYFNHVVCC